MPEEKEVLPAALALKRTAVPPGETSSAPASAVTEKPVAPTGKKWKFVKNYGVADVFTFKDGSTFSFRQIQRNNDFGLHGNSFVVTADEKLADNLRELAKNPYTGVVEVSV